MDNPPLLSNWQCAIHVGRVPRSLRRSVVSAGIKEMPMADPKIVVTEDSDARPVAEYSVGLIKATPERRMLNWLRAIVLLFGGLFSSLSVSQTAFGPSFWESQTNDAIGAPASTQQQALQNWMNITGTHRYGACEALGTSRYRFCGVCCLYNQPGGADVPLICAVGGVSQDGLTCPGVYYVSTDVLPQADCGCDKNNNNKFGDPINPSNGTVTFQDVDISPGWGAAAITFARYYNSADTGFSDMATGWRHSFGRKIIANVQATPYVPYFYSYARDSSLYSDPATACTSGWSQVSGTSSQWAGTTSSYTNGSCSLSRNGTIVATIPVRNAVQYPPSIAGTPVSFDAIRDDGQDVTFTLQGSTPAPPTGTTLRLTQVANGYQLVLLC